MEPHSLALNQRVVGSNSHCAHQVNQYVSFDTAFTFASVGNRQGNSQLSPFRTAPTRTIHRGEGKAGPNYLQQAFEVGWTTRLYQN